jgi:hypothetical protein
MAQGFLCRAWGETDFPEAALVQTREEIIAFIVSAQFGDTPLAELEEENRQIIEEQIAQMDLDVSSCDAKWEIEFEIGGIGVERCFFPAEPAPHPGVAALRRVIESLRSEARFMDEEGDETNALEKLLEHVSGVQRDGGPNDGR